MSPTPRPEVQAQLPLKATVFEVLLALSAHEMHGYAIVKQLEERSGGTLRIEPANLYRTLRTLVGRGFIEETDRRPDPKLDDERRRYFRITKLGREVARAEAARLAKLVEDARARRLLSGTHR